MSKGNSSPAATREEKERVHDHHTVSLPLQTTAGSELVMESGQEFGDYDSEDIHIFVVLGASGDLSMKKIYPTLWWLFRDGLLPEKTYFVGYSRSALTTDNIWEKAGQYMKVNDSENDRLNEFFKRNSFLVGSCDRTEDFQYLNKSLMKLENQSLKHHRSNRLFYLALPSTIYKDVASNIHRSCMAQGNGWTRVIVEKPFGRDSDSFMQLSDHFSSLFTEKEIYRIDHYLGKTMVQNMLEFRLKNQSLMPFWNRDHIASVTILFKEPFGTQGRGEYFDNYGIIRDVMQNHLIQILSLIAMERPTSTTVEDIRNEKVNVLKCISEVNMADVILGQYVGDPDGEGETTLGYVDDTTVPKDSLTPTFALAVLYINNQRWQDVPFILSSGKALNERKAEVRIQFREVSDKEEISRSELVFRIQPGEAIYMNSMSTKSGKLFDCEFTELDFIYEGKNDSTESPDAYERLILDAFRGSQVNFVRSDELLEAWRIFTPLLHSIEMQKRKPVLYKFGSHGLKEADDLVARHSSMHMNGTSANSLLNPEADTSCHFKQTQQRLHNLQFC